MADYDINTARRLRELMGEAARTVSYDGGDKWLSRELLRERARLGRTILDILFGTGYYTEFVATSIEVARDYIAVYEWKEARIVLRRARIGLLGSEDRDEQRKDMDALFEAVLFRGFSRGAMRRSARKRQQRKERRMLWRNEVTKRPLRRVIEKHRRTRATRTASSYLLHRRINERDAKKLSGADEMEGIAR